MKHFFLFHSLVCFSFLFTSAQTPNLIVSGGTVFTANISRGNYLEFSFRIKNTGSGNAARTYTKVYLSSTTSVVNATLLSEISCQPLSVNEETPDNRYVFPLPNKVTPGNKYIVLRVDARNEVAESNEANDFNLTSQIVVNATQGGQQNLPYPILLIHGLNSDYRTWDSIRNSLQNYFGWSYGGNMNFCLNQDGNNATANKSLDYKDWSDTAALSKADFYTLNFNVGVNGQDVSVTNPSVQSNQAAIVKQGIAVRDAIRHILKLTGRDKVILLTHSMGGLASREYLQNTVNWQTDGKHHVAKLATLGTPHGGSNTSAWGFSGLAGIDEHSEAVRDLRYDYYYSGAPGVYLFGGKELNSVLSNFLFSNYNNIDVNCNGTIDAQSVQGLNQKTIPNDLAYSCVIGDGSSLGGDGIVDAARANINNYYNLGADTFITISQSAILHLDLLNQIDFSVKNLDESGKINLAYLIDSAQYYFGNFTQQTLATTVNDDSDYYKIPLPENGELSVALTNIPVSAAGIKVISATGNLLTNVQSNSKSNLETSVLPVSAGIHSINIFGLPDATSWYSPYAFKIKFTGNGICPGNNMIYNAGISGLAYQWEVDTGTGFNPIPNNNIYSGVRTSELTVITPPTTWYGYKFRCLVDGSQYSVIKTLKFSVRWTGALNSQWENPANWNCGVLPDEKTDVFIYEGVPNFPTVSSPVTCRSIKMNQQSFVTIHSNGHLTLTGN